MTKEKIYSIGVDIGGTKMAGVLFDGVNVIADYSLATPKDDLNNFLSMLGALIEPLKERAKKEKMKIKGVGIGLPGVVDYGDQKLYNAPNVPFLNGLKIEELIKEKIGADLEIAVANDAKCFVRAEALVGAGRKYASVFGVTIGTGIGSGWWDNGKIFAGSHNPAMEISIMIVDFKERLDLERAYQKLTKNNPANMAAEAYRGDPLAEQSYTQVGEYLGIALANVVNLLDPEIIIVGGGVVQSSDLFLPNVKKAMKNFIINPQSKEVKLVKAKLGPLAGAIGAALLIS
jgi:glucokinase